MAGLLYEGEGRHKAETDSNLERNSFVLSSLFILKLGNYDHHDIDHQDCVSIIYHDIDYDDYNHNYILS